MGQGVRAGQHARGRHQHAAGDAEAAGEDRGRAGRLRQEESRQADRSRRPSGASINHFLGELLKLKTGMTWTEVHYRGNAPAINDLMAGHVDVGLMQLTDFAPAHRGREAPRAGGAGTDARAAPCPRCRPSSKRACPTCRASPSTACSRRRARRPRWSRSSARRSARRWRRKRSLDKLGELGSEARGSTPEEFTKFLAAGNREMDRRHAEGQHQGAR